MSAARSIRGLCCGSASREVTDSEDEFGEVEGFGQVVVSSEGESGHAVAWRVGSGEHQHHRGVALCGLE